ncbi:MULTISPECIES: aspartate/glutamate racemase family protein [Bifidobacterium]|uniref:Amino acid racemase n=1 Tax=Bifidobacterium tibiigranuli TaxID=2172043 RepID=A0A5N6S201_9BIFI|nr:amino acid racemase [Bifidobacterium tibiigranuli]KAE8127117.1 amino acid racemase [Bifidobacterium tibiigranuli]KAE8127660.1 aspartate racemase [Bifidobacterium tibiigranuli]
MRRPFFAVLGGMGTLATESYIRLVDQLTHAHTDQEYLDYVVFNDAAVPDRTAFILGESDESPVPALFDDIDKANAIGASFITLPCNTEHYFFDELQSRADVPILHMPKLAVAHMLQRYPVHDHPHVGFMGTRGSCSAGIYRGEVESAGYAYVEPDEDLQQRIDTLIYDEVKGGLPLSKPLYRGVIEEFLDANGPYRCNAVILGCTELSVFNEAFPLPELPIIDAQEVLAEETVARAKALL